MICPRCGSENPPACAFCQKCGAQFGIAVGGAPVGAPVTPPKKKRTWLIVPIVIAALLFGFIVVAAITNPYVRSPRYNSTLAFTTEMDGENSYAPGPGTITVSGEVTNDGTAPGNPSVYIKVFTGYGNESFYVPAGLIQPGGSVHFSWTHHFDQLNPLTVQAWTTFPE